MFDLERAVTEWRRQMLAAGIKTPAPLDELESHLREDIRALLSAGTPEEEAFQMAVSRLGSGGPLRTEFNKLKRPPGWPVTVGLWLYAVGMILTAVVLSRRVIGGSWNLLLYAHVVTFTSGYCAAFFAGGCGICYVCFRHFRASWLERQRWLGRATFLFSHLAAGLTIGGMVLGMIWRAQHPERQYDGYTREMAALGMCIWLVALCLTQRIDRVTERATMLMCIGGNIVLGLAWFGPFVLYGKIGYWPLAAFIAVSLLFLMLGLKPAPAEAETH